jgi:hypothetical protein
MGRESSKLNTVLIVLAFVVIIGVAVWGINSYSTLSTIRTTQDFKGEFDNVILPEDVVGTDLVANTSYAEDTNDEFNATFETSVDLNGTDGNLFYLAFQFEVDGGDMESLDIDGSLGSTIATTELLIKKAYIIADEKGTTVDSTDANLYTAEVKEDLDGFNFEIENIKDGKYVVVVEVRSMATVTIADAERLLQIEFDAETEGDVDKGFVYIINSI